MLDRIKETYFKYVDEMIAEGAWRAHAYAPNYLSDITDEVISMLKKIVKDEIDTYGASRACFKLDIGHSNLITKVIQADNMNEDERSAIADIINNDFMDKLADAFMALSEYYEKKTGMSLKKAYEEQE